MSTTLVPTASPAVPDLIRTFLDGRSPHTLTAYGRDLDDFARFLTGSRQEALGRFFSQPAPAANADVLRYRHDLVARQLAPATINRRLAAIRSLTKLARLLGVVPWAIEVQDVPQETLRDTRGPGVETVAEMMRLAAAPRDSYAVRNVAMLRVMFDLALRVSEVVRLDVVDLELDRGALWVSGKGRAEKEVLSLPANTQEAITAWLRVRGTKEGPLFLTLGPRRNRQPSRSRFTARGIYRIVSELGEQAGAKVWPHGLRHTAITSAVQVAQEHGVTLDEVRQFSRHKNINTLLVYRDRVRDVQGQLAAMVADTVKVS